MNQDLDYNDMGKLQGFGSDYWAPLLNKGYQKAAEDLKEIHRTRTAACRALKSTKIHENREISSDRVIVEYHFGRMIFLCTLFFAKVSLERVSLLSYF